MLDSRRNSSLLSLLKWVLLGFYFYNVYMKDLQITMKAVCLSFSMTCFFVPRDGFSSFSIGCASFYDSTWFRLPSLPTS
jgi:hypothetical protein